jgi:glycosyltransferase involved in cell wall biosynthesis
MLAVLRVSAAALPAWAAVRIVRVVTQIPFPSTRSDEVIVVVPCYNEAKRLNAQAFADFLDGSAKITVAFVDDGSTDDTPLILERVRQRNPRRVCTLRLSANAGKAEAVRRGVQVALRRRPAFVGYWDADLATPLETISRFHELLKTRNEFSLVMASRVALLGRQIRRSGARHFAGRAFATAASVVLGLPVYDTQCGAKLFRVTDVTTSAFARPFYSRWVFDVEILARMAAEENIRDSIYEYPLETWRDVAGSRLTPLDFVVAGIDLAAIYWRYKRRGAQRDPVAPIIIDHQSSDFTRRNAA